MEYTDYLSLVLQFTESRKVCLSKQSEIMALYINGFPPEVCGELVMELINNPRGNHS